MKAKPPSATSELLANLNKQEQEALAALLKKLLAGLEPTTTD